MAFEDINTPRHYLTELELVTIRRVGPYLFGAFAVWRFLNSTVHDPTLYPYQFYFQAEQAAEEALSVWTNLH